MAKILIKIDLFILLGYFLSRRPCLSIGTRDQGSSLHVDASGGQWVGALLVLKVPNINALRESPAPSPLKIMGSARWPFRVIWLSMHYKEGPCRPLEPLAPRGYWEAGGGSGGRPVVTHDLVNGRSRRQPEG